MEFDENGFEKDKDEPFWGQNVHWAVLTGAVGGPPLPEVALAMRITRADDMKAVAPLLVDMVTSLKARFPSLAEALFDMGYSLRTLNSWLYPLARLGVFSVFDLPDKSTIRQKGELPHHSGAVLWNGWPMCPVLAKKYPPPEKPRFEDPDEAWIDYRRKQALFEHSMFRRRGLPTPDLVQRCECPACAGWAICPHVESSLDLPRRAATPVVEAGEEPQPKLPCCAKRITLHPEDGAGYRQADRVDSDRWAVSYGRRTTVERYVGMLKASRQWERDAIRTHNPAGMQIMITFVGVAANSRKMRCYRQRMGLPEPDWKALAFELGAATVLDRHPPRRPRRCTRRRGTR